MLRQRIDLAAPAAVLVALAACGPAVGTSDGGGSATAASTGVHGGSLGASESSHGPGDGSTTAASDCPQSDLPPPFCHVAQSYGSTLETDSDLVPTILMPLVSPELQARLIIEVENEYRLVDAQDFSRVHGVSSANLFGDVNVMNFVGDFNGDGVLDLGVADNGNPVELYDGADLSLMATGPSPREPSNGNEFPSGWPAAAIDADGDGIDEVMTVELGHDLGIWRVASGTLEPLAEYQDVMTPCPGAFLRADFNGDGKGEVGLPTSGVSCWDGLDPREISLTIKLIPSPVPDSLGALPAIEQGNGAHYRAAGDLDGDGMDDVVLSDIERVTLLRSTRFGFEPLESREWVELDADGSLSLIRGIGDVDGDGRSEILLSVFDQATQERIRRLHWGGTLHAEHHSFPPAFETYGLADLNGDGRAEILATQIYPDVGREELIYWSR